MQGIFNARAKEVITMKCKECRGCMEAKYFNNSRFWYCWLCDTYYRGLDSNLEKVSKEDMNKFFWENGLLASTVLSTEHNKD